jgi:IS605 OrfB family transposase
VRREAGRWFCSFTVEVRRGARAPPRPAEAVGVDLGVSNLAVLSTGVIVPNPRHLDAAQRKIGSTARAVSRRAGPHLRAGAPPSARAANPRRDGLHKLTTSLARGYGTVVVEDLNVAGMLANRRLARRVADAGFGEIRRQLADKTAWNGGVLAVADRWFPSSQCHFAAPPRACSACQTVQNHSGDDPRTPEEAKLSLAARTFTCHNCGLVLDRDLNAARNLEHYVARRGRETRNGRGADQKTRQTPGRWLQSVYPAPDNRARRGPPAGNSELRVGRSPMLTHSQRLCRVSTERKAGGPHDGERLDVDVRFLLANERTLLAWLRTALTLVAGGVALAQFASDHAILSAMGVGLLVLGSSCGVIGYVRYRAAGQAIRAGRLPAPGRGPAMLTAGVVVLAAILTVIYSYDQLS